MFMLTFFFPAHHIDLYFCLLFFCFFHSLSTPFFSGRSEMNSMRNDMKISHDMRAKNEKRYSNRAGERQRQSKKGREMANVSLMDHFHLHNSTLSFY